MRDPRQPEPQAQDDSLTVFASALQLSAWRSGFARMSRWGCQRRGCVRLYLVLECASPGAPLRRVGRPGMGIVDPRPASLTQPRGTVPVPTAYPFHGACMDLYSILVCPVCKGDLAREEDR